MATARSTKSAKPTQGNELVAALKVKYGHTTDGALAKHLGVTTATLKAWRRYEIMTPKQILSVLGRAEKAAEAKLHHGAIRPIVEFFPLDKVLVKTQWEMFDASKSHPYLHGLYEELRAHHGVYIFFDSSGHAIYAGKARRVRLWWEMKLAFNRDRDGQGVKRVSHPSRKQAYKTNDEKARQIVWRKLRLHELAAYVSAYAVVDEMVNEVEAMLVRSFANNLLNVRMERFSNGVR